MIKRITKVTVAFVLILILLNGCGKDRNFDATSTLPFIGPADITVETTELSGVGIEDTTTQLETEQNTETEQTLETDTESTKEETTTSEETEGVSTDISEKTEAVETEQETTEVVEAEPTKPQYTFTEMATYMYVNAAVNVRTLPCIDGEKITVFGINHEVWVTGRCNETGWYRIDLEGQALYISDGYLSAEKVVEPVAGSGTPTKKTYNTSGFVYYTVSGRYPDRSYEEYLYSCLVDRGIAWWFPYAVAQIWQESCWSPTSYNGVDAGICQFNEETFSKRAAHHANFPNANIWNPYDSLYVYSFYIRDILLATNNDVEATWSYYFTGHLGSIHSGYCSVCWKWYNLLDAR